MCKGTKTETNFEKFFLGGKQNIEHIIMFAHWLFDSKRLQNLPRVTNTHFSQLIEG